LPPAAGPAGLAAALLRLRDDQGLALACIAAGRAGRARFEPQRVAQQLATAYAEAHAARIGYDPRGCG